MNLLVTLLNVCIVLGLGATCPPAPGTSGNIPSALASQEKKPVSQQKRKEWQPATWRGLTVGTSTKADVLKLLGKPIRQDFAEPEDDSDDVWYIYNDVGDFPGQFTVQIDKVSGHVTAMRISMTQDVKKEVVLDLLGKDYEIVRSDACPGFEELDAAPFYRSSNGSAVNIDYASLGISVSIDSKGNVYNVEYRKEPQWLLNSMEECRQELTKQRDKSKRQP